MGRREKLVEILKSQLFGCAILACAAISFSFPSAFTSWGGVKLTKLVTPAIQVVMFGMGTTLTLADLVRVAKCPWAVAAGVFLQFLVMPIVGFSLALAFGCPRFRHDAQLLQAFQRKPWAMASRMNKTIILLAGSLTCSLLSFGRGEGWMPSRLFRRRSHRSRMRLAILSGSSARMSLIRRQVLT